MIYCMLDTNICIYAINARPPTVLARFRQERLGSIGISSVTAAELAFGVAKSGSTRNREVLEMFLAPLEGRSFGGASGGTDSVAAQTMGNFDTVAYALFSIVGLTTAGRPAASEQISPG